MIPVARLVLRTQVTRGRAAALGAVAAVGFLLAVAVGRAAQGDVAHAAYDLVDGFALGLLVPVVALVYASAALGDPAEDGTLVYLWLRPIPRWQLAVAAFGASLATATAFGVLPAVLVAAASGVSIKLVGAAFVSAGLATAAYTGLFLGLGLVVRRALAWGLAYLLIWEGFVARSGTGAARLSVLVYARSLLARLAGEPEIDLAASTPYAVAVPLLVAAAAVAITSWWLRRTSVA